VRGEDVTCVLGTRVREEVPPVGLSVPCLSVDGARGGRRGRVGALWQLNTFVPRSSAREKELVIYSGTCRLHS